MHFTRAAARAGIEQSPLSRSIRNLETRLNVQLLERTKRSTRLTLAGERLLVHARALLAAADEARADVGMAGETGASYLRLGICDGVPLPRVARLLATLRQSSPYIRVHVHEMPMARRVHELQGGFLDAALAPESGYGKDITAEALWRAPLVVIVPSRHPLSGKEQLKLVDVAREPLVLCRPDTGLGQQCQIEQIVRTATATPNIVDRVTTLFMLVMFVIVGYGVRIATAAQLEAIGTGELALVPLHDTPMRSAPG